MSSEPNVKAPQLKVSTAIRRKSPRAFEFEGQWGVITEIPQDSRGKSSTSLLEGTHNISYTSHKNEKKAAEPRERPTCWSWRVLWGGCGGGWGGLVIHCRDKDTGGGGSRKYSLV